MRGLTAPLARLVRALLRRSGYDLIRAGEVTRYWCDDLPGWFTANEARLLYAAVRLHRPARLLEIGTFLGRSTATIALAIRDGGFPCAFSSVDFDVADEAAFLRLLPTTHGRPSVMPREYRLAFAAGLSTSAYARRGLKRHGLDHLVTLISGDFHQVTTGPHDLVFADCLHDEAEIRHNLPAITARLSPGGVLAIHDATPANRGLIAGLAPELAFIVAEDSLALYRAG